MSKPVEVAGDQIQTLTENNQCSTMRERAGILKIAKSMKLLVKIKNVSCLLQTQLNRLSGQPNNNSQDSVSIPLVPGTVPRTS